MDQLGTVLAQIAAKLGVAVDRLWPQLVAVTFYTSLAWAILTPLLILFSIVAAYRVDDWCRRKMELENNRRAKDRDYLYAHFGNNDGWWVLRICTWLTVVGIVIWGAADYPGVLAGVFAPEGVTVLNLLKAASGK